MPQNTIAGRENHSKRVLGYCRGNAKLVAAASSPGRNEMPIGDFSQTFARLHSQ
jgi:hypothetical protein